MKKTALMGMAMVSLTAISLSGCSAGVATTTASPPARSPC